jgi:hypothetical protein
MKQSSISKMQSFPAIANETLLLSKELIITGKVCCQEESFPLENVRISVKGTKLETFTKPDGTWLLRIPRQEAILVFSFAGFKTHEQVITKGCHLDVVLNRTDNPLTALFYSTVLQHQIHA